jgi:hypothetical protein
MAAMIGVGAWWWSRQRTAVPGRATSKRGQVIFHNTPEPTALSGEGVI